MLEYADDVHGSEFFRPLVTGWLAKVESALTCKSRKKWHEVSQECLMFYSKSAAAMWDGEYTKKFWRGVKAPKFRVTINKAFELVAILAPNLIWDVPHRTCSPKKRIQIPQELFPDPQMYEALQQQITSETAKDKLICHLMETWLNYTPREQPGGGLEGHNELAIVDVLVKGMGTLWPRIYKFPGSERTLTGCFHERPDDLLIDPDFRTIQQAKWICLRHQQHHREVEERFGMPANSMKNKSRLESSWHYSELQSTEGNGSAEREGGKTNDLVIWYEIWSKMGVGAGSTSMPDWLKSPLEQTVGKYAYLCICPDCPYPLNCPADKIRNGATSDDVRKHFEWPIPLWTDDRWPVEALWFYPDPEGPWPIPPLAPALGELKAINCIVSWLVNRTWQSSRQMWAVLGQYHDDMKKQLEEGDDLSVFSIPAGATDDIKKICQLIEQKEVNADSWKVLDLLYSAFDKRVGLPEGAYGKNEDGTQNRTAEETMAKQQAIGVRPQHMQKRVVSWQSRLAGIEAILAWMFVKGQDAQPLFGQVGSQLWDSYIANSDYEQVVRQMGYEVAAASIRRPNRDRDVANLQEVAARILPVMQTYGESSGNYEPVNGFMKKWGELHDMDVDGMLIPPPDPNDPSTQLQQQLQQAEVMKTTAEAKKAEAEAQANPMLELQMEAEMEQQKLAMEQQAQQQEAAIDLQKAEAELQMDIKRLEAELAMKKMELQMKAQEHQMDMAFKQQESQVDLAVKKEQGAQQIAQGNMQLTQQKEQHEQQMQQQKQGSQVKVQTTKAQSDAKVQAMKAQSKAKPKPQGK